MALIWHVAGAWGRVWAVVDGETVKWWAAKGDGKGIDWSAPKRTIPLLLCTVKEPPFEKDPDRSRFVFAIVSGEGKGGGKLLPKLFQAHSDEDYTAWIGTLRDGVMHSLSGNASHTPRTPAHASDEALASPRGLASRLLSRTPSAGLNEGESASEAAEDVTRQASRARQGHGNDVCADCGVAEPMWCSINLGILMCTDCSGAHRSLGVHVSKVRSLQLDRLDSGVVDLLATVGNTVVNSVLEAALYDQPRLGAEATGAERAAWVHRKYLTKELCGHVPGGAASQVGVAVGGLAVGWEEVFDVDGSP